jgi:adenine-specific DNA-methyltransferase
MALLETKIDQISDPELRKVILEEVKKLKENKQFGLVFEHHIPEVVPIYSAPIRPRAMVAKKTGKLNETYRVKRVFNDKVELIKDTDGSIEVVPSDSVVVVKQFGEPIYPALIPVDKVINSPDPNAPHHILIEADNYHSLQLLEYLYPGKVDCIYIDPPYNTGARDWKYNNDYVDKNDSWRHSKWLSMMKKRLVLSKKILKEDGVLVCAIDENELATLWLLLKEIFRNYEIVCVSIVHHPRGTQGDKFSFTHEYALFVYKKTAVITDRVSSAYGELYKLRRWGSSSERHQGRTCFYPIYVKDGRVVKIGEVPDDDFHPSSALIEHEDGTLEFWPKDSDGIERKWRYARNTITEVLDRIVVTETNGEKQLQIGRATEKHKTVWIGPRFDAGSHGSKFVSDVLGVQFPYPKSIYTVYDCIRACTKHNKNALIVDFFAGSGTTLNAVNLLNIEDEGSRQCIMVTNNEVSEQDAKTLTKQGFQPGHPEWEKLGICRSITWPRSKYTILGVRDDGTQLSGDYLTNQTVEKRKPRTIKHIGFTTPTLLNTAEKKKQLVALIDGIPQNAIKRDTSYFVSDDSRNFASILFDEEKADEYLSAIKGQEHIKEFYIVASTNRRFNQIKDAINELLGPIVVLEEQTRPLSLGFPTNLDYFKLDFLDPNEVALGKQFEAILPILWMMAGAKGQCPSVPSPTSSWLVVDNCPFAVLLHETKFKDFVKEIKDKNLTHVFLVTNSEDAFFDMKSELNVPNVIMLYKQYLKNFEINRNWKD